MVFNFLEACNSDEKKKEDSTITSSKTSASFKTLDTTITFSGYWVNESYVKSVRKTKSPVKTEVPRNSCIWIPDRTLQLTGMIAGFHQGGEALVMLLHDNKYELWDEKLENKRYDIYFISNEKLRIGTESFIKIRYVINPNSDSQPTILEELLFKGHYDNEDGSIAEFTGDGSVKGLENLKSYSAYIDYVAESNQVDIVALGETKFGETRYGYKFNNDTLFIYNLICAEYDSSNKICMFETFGELKYKLVKRN